VNLVHYCIERYLALALVYLGVVEVVLPRCLPLRPLVGRGERRWAAGT